MPSEARVTPIFWFESNPAGRQKRASRRMLLRWGHIERRHVRVDLTESMSRRYRCLSACLFLTLAMMACGDGSPPPLLPLTSPAPPKKNTPPLVSPPQLGSSPHVRS